MRYTFRMIAYSISALLFSVFFIVTIVLVILLDIVKILVYPFNRIINK